MLAMAAMVATLEAIENDGMIANATAVEHHLRRTLAGIPNLVSIKGKGCLLGIEFDTPCGPIHAKIAGE